MATNASPPAQPPPTLQTATSPPSSQTSHDLEKSTPPQDQQQQETPPRRPLPQRLQPYLTQTLSPSHQDLLILTCCFISGLVDSTIYNAFGTFVSMQTGNTIFLGLGGATPHTTGKPYGWAKSFISLGCFALGCMFFSHLTGKLGNKKRRSLVISFGLQTVIMLVSASVVQGGVVNGSLQTISDDVDWWTAMPIALLSFQSSGQIVSSRGLGLAEVPTVVLTSMIHDIMTDRGLVQPWGKNVKRNRRVVAFFLLLGGAIAGGFIAEGTDRMQIPLWIATGIKLGITIAWTVWPAEKVDPK